MGQARPILRLAGVLKRFGGFTALHSLDLDVLEGEFLTIVGPSGSGKTTLIRLMVGMDEPTDGTIWLRNRRIDQVPASRRPTCMVFQSLALFPHRSVGQNIEFPLKIRGVAPAARRDRALELMALLHLPEGHYDKRVTQCSGGERQRVALARALAFDPEILFFDEPLSALDHRLRKTLQKELKELHGRTGKTFVYITHSLEEAMVMSDRIAILRDGRFEQIATAAEIYHRPRSRFVAEFMGEVNLFPVTAGPDGLTGEGLAIRPNGSGGGAWTLAPGRRGTLVVRPEVVRFLEPEARAEVSVSGRLREAYALGSRTQYEIETEGGRPITLEALGRDVMAPPPGSPVSVGWSLAQCHLIAED